MTHRSKILPIAALTLVLLLFFVIVFSWIVSSISPSSHVHSLISGEGIRWFMGGFTSCLSNPLIVWILVGSIAWGAVIKSGFLKALKQIYCKEKITYRQKHALVISCALFVVSCLLIILLAFIPHAALLGATGSLYPSPFSSGVVPLIAFIVVIVSSVYGISCGELSDIRQVFECLYVGVKMSAPIWPLYIFAMQLYLSIMFVFFET